MRGTPIEQKNREPTGVIADHVRDYLIPNFDDGLPRRRPFSGEDPHWVGRLRHRRLYWLAGMASIGDGPTIPGHHGRRWSRTGAVALSAALAILAAFSL